MDKLELIKSKIIDNITLERLLVYWRFRKNKIVFTNGCFDIIHLGHIKYLAKAASLGDILLAGLNTDRSVRILKGKDRPFQNEESRAMVLASLQFIDRIILFDQETPYDLIKKIKPDVLVKGADYKPEDIVGYDIVKAEGGEIVTIDIVKGYSTSSLIKRI
ncbi:MAG: D-glycero-beta-D-manno-heptose 1-phosphate adenylyltransferase [Bacteroidales bacterium]|jgi:rfaE bifunctional protein nucleotidyltransferase chain/domain|nr:D-glycero-beta-D-manno-heptose 1-phosphate adenylyltransferase [Bacteroidales bacterium]